MNTVVVGSGPLLVHLILFTGQRSLDLRYLLELLPKVCLPERLRVEQCMMLLRKFLCLRKTLLLGNLCGLVMVRVAHRLSQLYVCDQVRLFGCAKACPCFSHHQSNLRYIVQLLECFLRKFKLFFRGAVANLTNVNIELLVWVIE